MMKTLIVVLTAVVALQLQSIQAASAEAETRFLVAAKQAFAKQDVAMLMALVCWDRVPEKFKASRQKQYARDLAGATADITLTDPDPNFPDHEWKDNDGVAYRANLPVVKQLKIKTKTGSAIYPVGEKDGQLYLLAPAPVK